MLHMMCWSRPDIINSVCECSMMISCTMESRIKAMNSIIKYVVTTVERVLLLKTNVVWNGGRGFLFGVTGMIDSDYAKYDSKKSVSGWSTLLNGEATSFRGKLIPAIALSVTESELFPEVMCSQDMLLVIKIHNCVVLKLKLPMKL